MTDTELKLDALRKARSLLATGYMQWTIGNCYETDEPFQGCASGAIIRATSDTAYDHLIVSGEVQKGINRAAEALYPEYTGVEAPRADRGAHDHFNGQPFVWVNNHLGKEATLAVFDSAILELEIQLDTTTPVAIASGIVAPV